MKVVIKLQIDPDTKRGSDHDSLRHRLWFNIGLEIAAHRNSSFSNRVLSYTHWRGLPSFLGLKAYLTSPSCSSNGYHKLGCQGGQSIPLTAPKRATNDDWAMTPFSTAYVSSLYLMEIRSFAA